MNHLPVTPVITEYLYQKAASTGVPLSGTFELTPLCNLNCKMCYIRLTRQQQEAIRPLSTGAQWLALAKEARDAGMLYLLLTGGEPFSHPDFREIMEGLHPMGLLISINSNGTLITEETVQWLKKVPPLRINVSLYGATNAAYERLCGDKQGFTKVERAIRLLKQAGIPVKLSCSITPQNREELPQIVAFAKENDLVLQTTAYMFPPIRKDPEQVGRNVRLTAEEAAYCTAFCEYLVYGEEDFLRGTPTEPIPEDTCVPEGDGIRCRGGKCSFWVTWERKLMACGMFPEKDARNLTREDFLPAWEAVKEQIATIRLPVECAGCGLKKECHACGAMVITESGCFDKVPEYRCAMTKAMRPQREKLVQQIKEGTLWEKREK